jgi:CRP-like cAMP-binding protein
VSQSRIQNKLLLKLTTVDFNEVWPYMERVDLTLKQEILTRGAVIPHVYFPEDCVASLLAQTEHVHPIEVGMFGFEGMSDMVVRDGDRTALTSVIQVAGAAWRIKADQFARLLNSVPSLNEVTLRYKEVMAIQFAYTALAHGSFTIEERLARWLLMSHDRSQRETIAMVHEFLAAMLAVRRSGITTATHVLEGLGAIKAKRGAITIRDRAKLLDIAGESYGTPEAEYDRLMAY